MLCNNNSNFVCSVCGDEFKNKNQFFGHLQVHNGDVMWNCKQCNDSTVFFSSQSKLIAHENLHHNLVRPFKCLQCDSVFERASQLDYHRRSFHFGEKSQVCHICDKGFFRKTDLNTHINIHLGTNQLICEFCGRTFNHISNLIRHVRSHAGMKPYPCSICGKRFTQLSSLTRHRKIHSSASVILPNKNNSRNNLENKKMVRRRHYCKTCGKSFHLIFLLRQHMQLHVHKIDNFPCNSCHQIFQSQLALQDHKCRMKSLHKNFENLKLSAAIDPLNPQIKSDDNKVIPILYDLGQKLGDIEINLSNHDESINITDILGSYSSDEIEFTSSSVIQLGSRDNAGRAMNGSCLDDTLSKDSHNRYLQIEQNQLCIEVCEADCLKHLELHTQSYDKSDKEFCSKENQYNGENSRTKQEGIEPMLRLVHSGDDQKLYELEINSLQLDQDHNNMIDYNSVSCNPQNTLLLTTPILHDNQWIEQSADLEFESSMCSDSHMNFMDDLQTNFMHHHCDTEALENYINSSGYDDIDIIEPMVRLVQNEEGAQFFELIRDSADYHRVSENSNNLLNDKLLENTLQPLEDTCKKNYDEQKNLKLTTTIKRKQKISRHYSQSKDQKFKCAVCNKLFTTKSNLKQHTGTHFSDQQKFKCKECGMTFAWKSTLNKHMTSNHRPNGTQKFVCEICPKVYNTLSQVNEHVKRDHLKERNHICPECGKRFFKKFDLKSHIRTHTDERPYVCRSCGKGFNHQSHIIRHERIHSGERPYSCDICQRSFAQLGSLKAHKQRHQNEEKIHNLNYHIGEDDLTVSTTI